ncbi:MAG: hypothetical protein ACOYOB_12200 [Myxococcota bacterium]|jgi:hypothetical protein
MTACGSTDTPAEPELDTSADDLRVFSLGEHTLRDCILSTRCQYRPTHGGRPAFTPYS